jgi:tight adherence protein C
MYLIFLAMIFIAVVVLVIQIFPRQTWQEETDDEDDLPEKGSVSALFRPLIVFLSHYNAKMELSGMKKSYERKIAKAGYGETLSPDKILAMKELACIGCPALAYGLLKFAGFTSYIFLIVFIAFVLGFVLPDIWLNDESQKRERAIVRAMPNFLDLLTLSVEAGMDFASGMKKVVESIKSSPLTQEIKWALQQIRIGETRKAALKKMGARIDVYEVSSFITAITQAEESGASLGPILRIQAEQLRLRRSERAEKLAGQAPIKMLAPLIICIFPAVFIILFGSIALQMLQGGGVGF